ncbi:MAG: CapA family protein [Tannerella sp.]|jgi:poly-gamma-glutamate synthesis protein (capsule biosynthesis protein)|nr:CapA family protein [Tannerella sp.]
MMNKRIFKLLITIFCVVSFVMSLSSCSGCRNNNDSRTDLSPDTVPVTDTIRLIFAGDVMGHSTQFRGAWRDGGDSCYNFAPTFQWVKDYISSADLAIANLEVTFAGEPYMGYPRFSSPASLAAALKDTGFDILLTANNHILDHGSTGLVLTIDALEKLGFSRTGSFKDSADWRANHPLMIRKNGFNLAFLNYTYGTNALTARPPVMVNYMDTSMIAIDMYRCKAMGADFIIACVHWGEEYQIKENELQRQFADVLVRNGCHLIIGAHPHVVQPIKEIDMETVGFVMDSIHSHVTDTACSIQSIPEKVAGAVVVAYSLGNLVSNQRWRYSDGGIMLEVTLTKTDSVVEIQSYGYEPFWVHRFPEQNAQIYRLILIKDYISDPERYPAITSEDERMLLQFDSDTKQIMND